MPINKFSLLNFDSISSDDIKNIFLLASKIKSKKLNQFHHGKTIGLLFFEASTRTRMSFEAASYRAGFGPLLLDGGQKSSLEKGESIEDSILNVAAMGPECLVIRCGDAVNLNEISKSIKIPIINAGWGVKGHPTQALLDGFTIQENLGSLEDKKILFVGDIRHSRVAASHKELLPKMKAKFGFCGPEEFLPESVGEGVIFSDLKKGLAWADVVMALRCQFERHNANLRFTKEQFVKNFGLNQASLKDFSSNGLIMHPGPINHGIEMNSDVLKDSRCKVLDQVSNGVYIREAILRSMMGEH